MNWAVSVGSKSSFQFLVDWLYMCWGYDSVVLFLFFFYRISNIGFELRVRMGEKT